MKINKWPLVSILFFFSLPVKSQPRHKDPVFKVIGYYSLEAAMSADVKTFPFDKLTHINLFFLNPDSLGNFIEDYSSIAPFVEAAHQHDVKVLASIAGGGPHPYYHTLLSDKKRATFIEGLTAQAIKYDLDGIDVDIEGSDIDAHYESFAIELGRSLRRHHKLMTAAIAVFYKDQLSDKALRQYDFVNIMSYDHTGPWRPEKPGPHAPFALAAADLDYFGGVRSIPKEKMTLGVPFYGYGFGPTPTVPAVTMDYAAILAAFPGADTTDQVKMPGDIIMHYNSAPTIRRKTALAKDKASGIMIWQLQGDAPGDASLLSLIYREALKN